MGEPEKGVLPKARKVLFLDVPGVLNRSKAPYAYSTYEADLVGRLVDIVKRTGCEVYLTSRMPRDVALQGQQRLLVRGLVGLVKALFPERRIEVVERAEEAIKVLQQGEGKARIGGYAVLLNKDDIDLSWQLTFPTRTIRTLGREGLSENIGKAVEAMLNVEPGVEEIPLKVVTTVDVLREKDRVLASLQGNDSGIGDLTGSEGKCYNGG